MMEEKYRLHKFLTSKSDKFQTLSGYVSEHKSVPCGGTYN
jgi:hypothetical protein